MRDDLAWSYTLSGAMNTSNALGYFIGALATSQVIARWGPGRSVVWGGLLAAALMWMPGFFVDSTVLIVQRLVAGMLSAVVFISGGILAARMGSRQAGRAGLILGLYYGGTGAGIVLSALVVPWILDGEQLPFVPWVWPGGRWG